MIADVSFRPLPARRGNRLLLSTALALGLVLPLAGCKTSAERADEYYRSGLELLEQGDADRAIVQFRNVFDIDGTHYEARKALADTYLERGDAGQAYSQYLRLAEQYPDDLATRIALARLAFDGQQPEEFIRHTTRAVEIAPGDAEVQVLDLARRFREATVAEDEKTRAALGEDAARMAEARPDDPLLLAIPVALAATCAFMLPVATPPNAIAYGSGYVSIPQMIKGGIWLNLFGLVLNTAVTMTLAVWVFGIAF